MPGPGQMDPWDRELPAANLKGPHKRVGCVRFAFGIQSRQIFVCYGWTMYPFLDLEKPWEVRGGVTISQDVFCNTQLCLPARFS